MPSELLSSRPQPPAHTHRAIGTIAPFDGNIIPHAGHPFRRRSPCHHELRSWCFIAPSRKLPDSRHVSVSTVRRANELSPGCGKEAFMRKLNRFNWGTTGFVLLGFAALAFLTTQVTHDHVEQKSESTYGIIAKFDNVADLKVGSRVSMAGVDIGRVISIKLDAVEHKAVVLMRLNSQFSQIPVDSSASINTQGLLGGKFIGITSGGSDTYLRDNDQILATRSAISLANLISQVSKRYLQSGGARPK
jgi:phospholipid/cholesterol/gamma-HCH transport system substrate-binding protein